MIRRRVLQIVQLQSANNLVNQPIYKKKGEIKHTQQLENCIINGDILSSTVEINENMACA
jgi:hypothetical protein